MTAYCPRQPGEHWRTRPGIQLVQVQENAAPWWANGCGGAGSTVIAVFRDPPLYRGYELRGGLRHARLLRILGRHG